MKLQDVTQKQKDAVKRQWLDDIFATYHPDITKFLKREKNQFANPVAHSYRAGVEIITEEIFGEMDAEKICIALADIVKIRAVQDYLPSHAISFVFLLKECVRREIPELKKESCEEILSGIDRRIDQIVLYGLDVFVKCREKMYELRLNELKRSVASVVRRLNRNGEDAELEPGDNDGTGDDQQTARC